MTYAVRYYTKTGNTKKLADAIARELGVEALSVEEKLLEKVDVLFLGSSVYAANVSGEVKSFIDDNKDMIGMVVNFSTAALLKSTHKAVKKYCDKLGVSISDEEFYCKGSFGIMHKGRPNDDDLEAAKEFARKIKG